jgi:hypothetical protein
MCALHSYIFLLIHNNVLTTWNQLNLSHFFLIATFRKPDNEAANSKNNCCTE